MKLFVGCKRHRIDGYVGLDIVKTNVTDHVVPWLQIDSAISRQTVSEIFVDRALERIPRDEIERVVALWKSLLIKDATITLIGNDFKKLSDKISTSSPQQYESLQSAMFGFKVGNFDFTHVYVYTKDQIAEIVEKTGLKITHQEYFEDFKFKIIATADKVEQVEHKTVSTSKSVPDHKATSIQFAVFGIQRSGTNFMQRFVTHNTKNAFQKQGWKHDLSCMHNGAGTVRIYMYKTPYKWIESIHRNHEDVPKRWDEKYKLMAADGADDIKIDTKHRGDTNHCKLSLKKLCRLYSDHLLNWYNDSKIEDKNIYLVSYESMIKDPQKWLIEFSEKYNFDIISANIHVPDKVQQSNKFTDQDRQYYTDKNNFRYLDDKKIQLISSSVDSKVFELFNMERL